MDKENLAAVLYKKDDLRLEVTPLPGKPDKFEVLLASQCVGICGSDVSYWTKGRIDDFIVTNPLIMGHETSATVIEVGEGVKHLKPGDRVAVEPGIPCRHCTYCREGKYNLCPDITFHATPPYDGSLVRYFKHASDFCFKLPDNVSLEEGAFIEPLSVAVYACVRAKITPEKVVMICGAGPIGLLCYLVAKAYGCSNICLTDILESRLKFAESLGAKTCLIKKENTLTDQVNDIELVLGSRPQIVIECSGSDKGIALGILAAKTGGCMVLVGLGAKEMNIPLTNAAIREIDIKGIFRYKNCYPKAISLLANHKLDVKPLITHRYKLNQVLEAFEMAKSGQAIKVMIDCYN